MNDLDRLAGEIAEQAPELRGDLVHAIDAALDLRELDATLTAQRADRLQTFRDALSGEAAIEACLDQLLIRRARAASTAQPTAAAVRRSLDEPTMWGEQEADVA